MSEYRASCTYIRVCIYNFFFPFNTKQIIICLIFLYSLFQFSIYSYFLGIRILIIINLTIKKLKTYINLFYYFKLPPRDKSIAEETDDNEDKLGLIYSRRGRNKGFRENRKIKNIQRNIFRIRIVWIMISVVSEKFCWSEEEWK